jgi:GWxTD domain-containing protein
MQRIRRLLDRPEAPRAVLTPVLSAAILAITAAVVLTAWQQQPQVSPPPATPYTKWLTEDVAYIITDQERAAFKRLPTDEEREHFIEQFWLRRDPTPDTVRNEFKEEHYRRIAYANQHYADAHIAGWKTDRGRIYITYGPPDEIDSHPSGGASTYPSEQWRYRFIEGIGINVIIEFVDPTGSGEYRMTLDPSERDSLLSLLGPSGGHVFASTEPGSQVTVAITSDRRMLVRIPIDFPAKQYEIAGGTRRSDTGAYVRTFQEMRSLCKDAPGTAGCLERPVFQPGSPLVGPIALEPGSYVFEATVRDRAGSVQKTYTVNFSVE